jgi:primosomal protein N' (replication factor Y)
VVDEEHEHAYKQESAPRYLATAVAAERARRSNAVLLMGSATPSVEAYYRACHEDGLSLTKLPERIDSRPLPPVEIIDLRTETLMGKGGSFSQMMLEAIADRLERGEQTILFLNRRGFSTFVMCRLGTERVADQIEREFEGASVARMDRDTVSRKGAHGDILRSFARGEADILVGTQMIAKGLDLANVTLVGVLNADVGLHTPDFRAAERTFQLLTQVAGRAGRAEKPGEVLVQTYNPDHYAIVTAKGHDYVAFYEREIRARRHNLYPPFVELTNLVFQDEDKENALNTARRAAVCLQDMGVCFKKGDVQFLGPAPAPLHKLRGRYRYQMLLKAADMEQLNQTVRDLMEALTDAGSTQVVYDVEPMDMM